MLRLAETVHNSRTIPDVVSVFLRQALEGRCHRILSIDDVRALIAALLKNPAYARRQDMLGMLHYAALDVRAFRTRSRRRDL